MKRERDMKDHVDRSRGIEILIGENISEDNVSLQVYKTRDVGSGLAGQESHFRMSLCRGGSDHTA